MRAIITRLALAALATGVCVGSAALPEPAAIVESARGTTPPLNALDYLSPGQSVELGQTGTLVIDYLRSCARESIEHGTVKIGQEESSVWGGQLVRTRFDCDRGGRPAEPGAEASSGAPGFTPPSKPEGQPHEAGIARTIYGTSPLFDMGGPGELTIEPIDPHGSALKLDVSAKELLRGRFYDFSWAGKTLAAGGVYRATAHGHSVVFWVDPLAHAGAGPPGGRLVRL